MGSTTATPTAPTNPKAEAEGAARVLEQFTKKRIRLLPRGSRYS